MTPEERRAWVEDRLEAWNAEDAILFGSDLDAALVGVVSQGPDRWLACYDRDLLIETLMADQDISRDDAEEWVGYNTEGSWLGEHTPVVLNRIKEEP